MSQKITSVTRLPHNAFADFRDVPYSQDKKYSQNHICTSGGLKNAMKRVNTELAEYSESHGNRAVCQAWIITPWGSEMSIDFAEQLTDFSFKNSNEMNQCVIRLNKINAEVNVELDAIYAKQDAEYQKC